MLNVIEPGSEIPTHQPLMALWLLLIFLMGSGILFARCNLEVIIEI